MLALVGLYRRTSRQEHLDTAMSLAQRVHRELGQFRTDDARRGWISGLAPAEGERHPTVGGLRIGKPDPERPPGAEFDERLEWDRDGQYFHFLTKWMVALNRLAHATRDATWNDWAIDLACACWPAFAAPSDESGTPRMHWKMSTDLLRPLVASMGHHDPLDGLATFSELRASQRQLGGSRSLAALDDAWADMLAMCERSHSWATSDALGIGGLLLDLSVIVRLTAAGECDAGHALDRALTDAVRSLDTFAASRELERPVHGRLAFREIGLAIGLHAADSVRAAILHARPRFGRPADVERRLGGAQALLEHLELRHEIERCWMDPAAQETPAWRSHEDINAVMLAAALVPDACAAP